MKTFKIVLLGLCIVGGAMGLTADRASASQIPITGFDKAVAQTV